MKLYEVANGYTGESYVRCLVIAGDERAAIAIATERYRADTTAPRHGPGYWEHLSANLLCEDTASPWAGEVSDA